MRIAILNGNPFGDIAFDTYVKSLVDLLKNSHHQVNVFTLRGLDLKYCIGCFGCWVKTPGLCVISDESSLVCRAYINSDLVIFASPIIMGFTSALLKKVHDKLLPLLHPYLDIVQNEFHHAARYDRYPSFGLLLKKGKDTDDEDLEIISAIYRRNAINLRTSLLFVKLMEDSPERIVYEINSL